MKNKHEIRITNYSDSLENDQIIILNHKKNILIIKKIEKNIGLYEIDLLPG